jgi:hypothetical protein
MDNYHISDLCICNKDMSGGYTVVQFNCIASQNESYFNYVILISILFLFEDEDEDLDLHF